MLRLPSHRLRTIAISALFSATTFFVGIVPTELALPRPEALTPAPTLALGCADVPSLEGRLTGSPSSTTAVTRTKTGNVFAYISKVVDDWSCTSAFRYDGIAWARDSDPDGNFAYGNLINSTSVACNWVIGSTDYLKANVTTDCPDSDAEYAMPIYLEWTQTNHELLETTWNMDTSPDAAGDFQFVHSDCTSYYGAGDGQIVRYNHSFAYAEVNNRPGDNCDPRLVESTNTTQSIVVDGTPPTLSVTAPAGASGTVVGTTSTSYGVTFNPSDNVADFGAGHGWTLQRQIAPNTAGGTCGTFVNDGAVGNLLIGTTEGGQTSNQTLLVASCYRWVLSGSDMNGNTATPVTSATLIVDATSPAQAFLTAQTGATISRNTTAFSVIWTETERNSGIATRSLQRQKVAATGSACPGTFANDGTAYTGVSPSNQILASGNCYQWIQTLTDKAGNTDVCTTGKVYVDTTVPMATVSSPVDSPTTYQTSGTVNVTWTETAGSGTVTSRSLQREKATGTLGTCSGLSWSNDGAADTGTSPRSSVTGGDGIYRWAETLGNSAGKSGTNRSGSVVIDTTGPTGSITYPETNRPLAGVVTILGTATDAATFKEYQIEYGAGASPGSWTSIGTYSTPVSSPAQLATWATGNLSGIYTIRLTVRENASASTSVTTRTVYLENARRGEESYYTRIPYDLGGDWALDVGVANGEARLSRGLFSIPSYGPPQELGLSYSSHETGAAGKFGVGWSSNLTQYLTFDIASNVTVWHRGDGGRVPFGFVGSAWVALNGHYETMAVAGSEVTITAKDQTQFVFESTGAGRLKRITNRFGKSLALSWGSSSATATDASGRVTTIAINATDARITGVTDSAGRAWAFGYTGAGASSLLTSVTDPASAVTTLSYTSSVLTGISRSRTRLVGAPETVTWTVGYTGGKVSAVSNLEVTTPNTFAYAAAATTVNTLVDETGPVYAPRTYFLADPLALGFVTAESAEVGQVPGGGTGEDQVDEVTRVFDPAGNLLSQAVPTDDAAHPAVTTYAYDARGNLTSQTEPLDASTSVTTLRTYSATNDLLTQTDADNDAATRTVTRYTYDGSGHRTSVNRNCTSSGTTIPSQGAGGSCTGAGTQDASTNVITNFAYTANDQLAYEQDPLGRVTKHVYDSHGNETSTIRNCTTTGTATPSPFSSCTGGGTQDAQTNVTTGSTFDAAVTAGKAGLATKTTDALGRDTTYTYDAVGRQLTEVQPGDSSVPSRATTSTFDTLGNSLSEIESWTPLAGGSPVTQTTSHVYDLANRETTLTNPDGITATDYWADGSEMEVTQKDTLGATILTTDYAYDLLPRLGKVTRLDDSGATEVTDITFEGGVRVAVTSSTNAPSDVTTTTRSDFAGRTLEEQTIPAAGSTAPVITTAERTYDALGRELTTTDAAGVLTTNTYDRLGRLLTSTIAGATTTHGYDRAGNATSTADPVGIVQTTAFDPLDRPASVVSNDVASPTLPTQDVTTTTYYDAAGNQIAVRDARGITTRSIVNVQGQVMQTIANCTDSGSTPTSNPGACTGAGTHSDIVNVVTNQAYDGKGNVIRTVSAVGRPAEATTETFYNGTGRVQATRDPRGTITRHVYDAAGLLTDTYINCTSSGTTILTSGWEACTGAGTADGTFNLRTRYTYDDFGRQVSVQSPQGRITRTVYDEAGRLEATIEDYTDGTPSAADDLTTTYHYDGLDRQAAVSVPTADGLTRIVNRTVFNADGTVAQEIRNCTDTGTTAPVDPASCTGAGTANAETNLNTSFTYDARGNRTRMTSPDPAATSGTSTATVTTQYAFDAADRLCRVVENATGSTDLQALADPCATATQTAGTTTTNLSTRYTYDGMGNLASMVDAAAHTTTYTFDAAGNSTSRTDALGKVLVWQYDALGNQTRQENRSDPPATASVVWTHDPAGRILTRVADGVTTTYTYDLNGNKLIATDGTFTITSTYDRLNRVLTVDDEDAGTTPDTSYTFSLTSPSWTDPSGAFTATLDEFDRQTVLNDPANATNFTAAYRADGQPATATQPNGNTTAFAYDKLGQLLSKDTTAAGPTNRALYDWTFNRAGQILTEASTITGDPANGTVTYAYDPLARLSSTTLSATTTTYAWDKVPNRTSVKVGAGTATTTTFDATNRPTSGANPTASYTSDDDGRLTARPNQTMTWDDLGRLTSVRNAAGTVTIAAYTYDPLDRLRMVDYGAGVRTRFRYVGSTTSAAQLIDDAAGTVTRNIGNDWNGERVVDWTGTNSNIRVYGSNAHHDVTWLGTSSGTVSQVLRYDPWGNARSAVPSGYTPFRFQGSFTDATTDISWVVTRWYAPALGAFISEDSLAGEPRDPDSRHLYAYGEGEPVGRWDPDGRYWRYQKTNATLSSIARSTLGSSSRWPMLSWANRVGGRLVPAKTANSVIAANSWIYVPTGWLYRRSDRQRWNRKDDLVGGVHPAGTRSYRALDTQWRAWIHQAQAALSLGDSNAAFSFTRNALFNKIDEKTGHRPRTPSAWDGLWFQYKLRNYNSLAAVLAGGNLTEYRNDVWVNANASPWFCDGHPCTVGQVIFLNGVPRTTEQLAHEYIHVLQWEGRGGDFGRDYLYSRLAVGNAGPRHPDEAPAYLYQSLMKYFGRFELPPWSIWRRPP